MNMEDMGGWLQPQLEEELSLFGPLDQSVLESNVQFINSETETRANESNPHYACYDAYDAYDDNHPQPLLVPDTMALYMDHPMDSSSTLVVPEDSACPQGSPSRSSFAVPMSRDEDDEEMSPEPQAAKKKSNSAQLRTVKPRGSGPTKKATCSRKSPYPQVNVNNNKLKFECPHCPHLQLASNQGLKDHLKRIHGKMEDLKKVYGCPHCSEKYPTSDAQLNHINKTHTDEAAKDPQNYFCPCCAELDPRKGILKRKNPLSKFKTHFKRHFKNADFLENPKTMASKQAILDFVLETFGKNLLDEEDFQDYNFELENIDFQDPFASSIGDVPDFHLHDTLSEPDPFRK